jgi:uncharacterized protein involved in exopolysaccharide biosynthesis
LTDASTAYVQASASYAGNLAQTHRLEQELSADQERLATLNEQTVPYDDLLRRTTELTAQHEMYLTKANEARLGDLLDQQSISNVAVVEQPTPSSIPTFPRRGLMLSLGFVWAGMLGAATAIGRNFYARRIQTQWDLQSSVGVPMLAAIPSNMPMSSRLLPPLYAAMQRSTKQFNRRAI